VDKYKHETHYNASDDVLSKHLEEMAERGWQLVTTNSCMTVTPKTEWDAGGNMIQAETFIWKRPIGARH
jgi:hypothetical protein